MIRYRSTRGDKILYTFSEVVRKGIAKDGGLFVPEKIPHITFSKLQTLSSTSYQDCATYIVSLFETDFSESLIKTCVKKAYSSNFDTPAIAPVKHLKNNQYILELWHGPTCAFKDMGLQLMPLFFEEAVKKENSIRIRRKEKQLHYLLLVATSGDTGKAALEGYKDKENISIIVFYPNKRVSKLQQLQMATQYGENVSVYALNGDFDVVQKVVKDIFNDKTFAKELLQKHQTLLSSANSINWGRLIPQIIYYVSSYADLVKTGTIAWGEYIDISVPTGNFGNILAGFYAKQMGIPIRKLICASNANNVLTDFLQTGMYDVTRRKLVQTPSPSMDILIASNIERLLYAITKDVQKVSGWMQDLKMKKKFTVDDKTKTILQNEFYAGWVSNSQSLSNIKHIYETTNYLMDPHTSVAQAVVEQYILETKSEVTVVICATAHFAKFPKDVYKALTNLEDKTNDEFFLLQQIEKMTSQTIPTGITKLREKKMKYIIVCDAHKNELEEVILQTLSSGHWQM